MYENVKELEHRTGLFPSNMEQTATYLFLFTIFILPLHTQLIYIVLPRYTGLPAEIVSMWKEMMFLIVTLILASNFLISHGRLRVSFLDALVLLFLVVLLIYVVASNKDTVASLYGFRIFAEPFIVYFIARTIRVDYPIIKTFLVYFFYLSIAISIWAIFQTAVLGGRFLIDLGYKSEYGRLGGSLYISHYLFQRAIGTFSSPNTFGIYLQSSIMLGVYFYYNRTGIKRLNYYLYMFVLLFGIIYSFSRSAWIALFISLLSFFALRTNVKKVAGVVLKLLFISFMLIATAILLSPTIAESLLGHVANTFSLRDPSAVGHIKSLSSSFQFILSNPFGIGLGMSGPRAILYSGTSFSTESSYFLLAFDIGIFGAILYLGIIFTMMIYLFSSIKRTEDSDVRFFKMIVLAILVGQIFAWNFLPYIVELEATIILFCLLGVALNNDMQSAVDVKYG